jgi:hypothetical protein
MANTTFSGPVRSEAGFQVATKNSTTGAVSTRYSNIRPDLTGLSIADVDGSVSAITLAADTISVVDYTGAASCNATLPAATAGTVVVYNQAKDTAGGTEVLTFDCAGSDAIATSSNIESRATNEVTYDTSASGETKITFTPANAATNLLTTGGKIYFICFQDGTWNLDTDLSKDGTDVTGAFAFSA